ncbi:MAG: hypothetical protein RDV48_08570 [Candidatus Eremiobacteraeota bacterium]|nr:hypothetical protein [Candidatus Eremiobacteraeota bacterium]
MNKGKLIFLVLFTILSFSIFCSCGGGGGGCNDDDNKPPETNPEPTKPPEGGDDSNNVPFPSSISSLSGWSSEPSGAQYMDWFLNSSQNPNLNRFLPNYSYFQGLLYSNGKVEVVGPVRVIGGVFSSCDNAEQGHLGTTGKENVLQKGAMITTDSEYLQSFSVHPAPKLHITQWEEVTH